MSGKFEEEETVQEQEPQEEEYDYSSEQGSGESIQDKPTIDKFYDTENILYSLEKTFRGFQKKDNKWVKLIDTEEIARDEFINLTINSLRSVINPENIISKKSAEEVETILLEKNIEFIDVCEDEITLDDDYVETIINIYDHSLELFMGLVQGGHGAQTLKEIYAGIANVGDMMNARKEDSTFRLAVGDRDLVNIGMKER